MPSPTTTGHALLSLIALRPNWSTYELAGQVVRNLRFLWPRAGSAAPAPLTEAQFNALVLGLPWQRLEQMAVITHV